MEPLHPREVAIKELGPAKADEKIFDKAWAVSVYVAEPLIRIATRIPRSFEDHAHQRNFSGCVLEQ